MHICRHRGGPATQGLTSNAPVLARRSFSEIDDGQGELDT
jgi:hypothetical protein